MYFRFVLAVLCVRCLLANFDIAYSFLQKAFNLYLYFNLPYLFKTLPSSDTPSAIAISGEPLNRFASQIGIFSFVSEPVVHLERSTVIVQTKKKQSFRR